MNVSTDVLQLFEEKKLLTICAPMVRYSKLQFRSLVREYKCDLCYTSMIMADSFCRSPKARNNEFTTNLSDAPLIAQFAANTVHDFVGAAYMIAPYCSGVDLNCGCPQTWAKQMGIGSAMLNQPELMSDLVKQCRNRISKPFTVSVKLRLLKDVRKTIEMCRRLEKAGVSYLAVHARTPSQHSGNIDVEGLKLVVENVACPVVGNGGVKSFEDCVKLQEATECQGVMAANGLLTNPALFAGVECTPVECVQKWLNICYNSTLDAYDVNNRLHIPQHPPNLTFQCFHHHLVFMLEKILVKNKRRIFNNLQNFHDVLVFLNQHLGIRPQLYDCNVFKSRKMLELNYYERDEVYDKLKLLYNVGGSSSIDSCTDYNCESTDGTFFRTKVTVDEPMEFGLENMFL